MDEGRVFLRRLRKQSGYKSKEFAKLVGISPAAYSNIENGYRNPRLSLAERIANKLGSTVDRLFVCQQLSQNERDN